MRSTVKDPEGKPWCLLRLVVAAVVITSVSVGVAGTVAVAVAVVAAACRCHALLSDSKPALEMAAHDYHPTPLPLPRHERDAWSMGT